MAEVSPPSVEELKRAVELESSYEESTPRTPTQALETASRIFEDWQAATAAGRKSPDLLSFVRDVAATEPVTSGERGQARAFWSWRSRPEGATAEVGHRFVAQACGEERGFQVLEDTPAGRQLDSYHLWAKEVQQVLARDFELDLAEVEALAPEVWSTVSGRYAEAATGEVVVFAADIGAGSVLGKDELPRLLAHEQVGKEGVRFPLPSPRHEHLPPEVDELIADEAVRCQVRMEDFRAADTTPRQFAQKLAGLDVPEGQREAHREALARLSAVDSYEELRQPDKVVPDKVVPARANAFLPGVAVRPTAAQPSPRGTPGHGVVNPVAVEAAPKSAGISH
ncbi:hypothetical protein [Streptomyces sp. NPDC006879]|uniref:hypothetical protein n=1 Tax=Streptomyces sp. NPDC006879 TaxID=3364767 RepID=UPI0036CA593A